MYNIMNLILFYKYYIIHINIQDNYTEHLYGLLRVFQICILLKVHIYKAQLYVFWD